MIWLQAPKLNVRSTSMTSDFSSARTWITAPSSSLNKARRVSSLRRSATWPAQFLASPQSLECSPSMVNMSRLTDMPVWPAKAISVRVAYRPPSERSW
ncbi:hypothetical protein D3C81_1281490 [compost metagenome]